MPRLLITYYSKTGNTEKMAQYIKEGALNTGCTVELKKVEETTIDDFLAVEGIVMGSPTYYGVMASSLKKLLDESVKYHGKLEGKVGGAFTSSANLGGGNETTILSILQAMLIHGMVVAGDPMGDHYGPVSLKAPDEVVQKKCIRYGQRIGELVSRLFPGK